MLAVFNSRELSQAQVPTFAYHFAAQFGCIDPHNIIGAVPDINVAFAAGLDVGADTAVPQKVDLHAQYGVNQRQRPH